MAAHRALEAVAEAAVLAETCVRHDGSVMCLSQSLAQYMAAYHSETQPMTAVYDGSLREQSITVYDTSLMV